VFSRPLVLATIPKAWGFEAATRFKSTLMGGSLIPIVVIGMGMALTRLNTYGIFGTFTNGMKLSDKTR